MPSLYPASDGDVFGDDGQRAQDAAYGLHLQVHVEGTPAQLIRLDTKLSLAASVLAHIKYTPISPGV